MIAEYDGSGNLTSRYLNGPGADTPMVWFEGANVSNVHYLIPDAHGRRFTATGLCRTPGVATGTAFIFSGTNTDKAFDISVTMFPEQAGPTPDARRMTVTGTLTGG